MIDSHRTVEKWPRCHLCANVLVAGRCVFCDTRRWSQVVHREIVLLGALMVLTAAIFVVTRFAAADHEAIRRQEAFAWFQAARVGVRSETTIEALRRAVAKDPRNREYRLALAQAERDLVIAERQLLASVGRLDVPTDGGGAVESDQLRGR